MSIKRFFITLLAATLFCAGGCGKKKESEPQTPPEEPAAPTAVALEDFFDWGSIRQGDLVEHKFQIRNSGKVDLVISRAQSAGGCVASITGPSTIPPGQTGEITAKFDSTGRQGPSRKTISVFTNDPKTPELKVAMGGFITTDVEVSPSKLNLGEVMKSKKASARFKLNVKEASSTKISTVTLEDPQFSLKLVEGNPNTNGEYEVTFLGSDKLGPMMVRIDISTEGSSVPTFKLPIDLVVVGDLKYPRNLSFFKGADEKYAPKTIEVTSRSGKNVAITKAEETSGTVVLDITTPKGTKAQVQAQVSDRASSLSPRGKIALSTTNKDEPLIEIEYLISKGKGPQLMPTLKPIAAPN